MPRQSRPWRPSPLEEGDKRGKRGKDKDGNRCRAKTEVKRNEKVEMRVRGTKRGRGRGMDKQRTGRGMPGRHLILTAHLPPNTEVVRRTKAGGLRPPNISNAGEEGFSLCELINLGLLTPPPKKKKRKSQARSLDETMTSEHKAFQTHTASDLALTTFCFSLLPSEIAVTGDFYLKAPTMPRFHARLWLRCFLLIRLSLDARPCNWHIPQQRRESLREDQK